MVIAAGGRPRFVDVTENSGNMDPEKLRERICANSGAILVTHLHGITADMGAIGAIAREKGLPLIEDTAQALGAETANGFAGTLADAGVASFGTYKNVNSWFGGIVLTKHSDLAAKIKNEMAEWAYFDSERLYAKVKMAATIDVLGWKPLFSPLISRIFRYGFVNDVAAINRATAIELDTSRYDELPAWYRSRFTPAQARRVLEQWPKLHEHSEQRIAYAKLYDEGFEDSGSLVKPPAPNGRAHVYTYYPLQAARRKDLLKWLMYLGRDIAPQHLKNCAQLESFKEFASPCPVAEKVAASVILLPTYPSYGADQVRRNLQVIRWYVEQGEPEFQKRSRLGKEVFAQTPARALLQTRTSP
jgi:perosamine synthetase